MVDRPPLVIDGSHGEFLDWGRGGCSGHTHEVRREPEQQAQEACAGCQTRTDTFSCGARKWMWVVHLTLYEHRGAAFSPRGATRQSVSQYYRASYFDRGVSWHHAGGTGRPFISFRGLFGCVAGQRGGFALSPRSDVGAM